MILFTYSCAYGVDFSSKKMTYSDKYFSGKYLIYDCQDGHWVCADVESRDNCEAAVQRAIPTDTVELPCFVAEEFASIDKCVEQNKKVVSNLGPTRNCYHPKYKKRIILY
ncbi:hypothetical protein N9B72_01610 [Bacteriovoracaceae bacterium]|nr:hypothetical protein [Bacteriovoracaceae bacterium]